MIFVEMNKLGKISTGNTPSKKQEEYYKFNDIGFVKPDILNDHSIVNICETKEYISEIARPYARIAKVNSVLVTCIGSIGKIGIVKNKECAFNQQLNAIEPNHNVSPEYLAYCLLFNKQKLINAANAPVVPIINKTQFENFKVYFEENIDTQVKIASTLIKMNKLVSNKKEQIGELDSLVQARFVEMFGSYPINQKGWDIVRIRDVVKEVKYGTSRPATQAGKYPYLRMNNITYNGELELSDIKYIDVPKTELSNCTVQYGDVLFNRTNSKELVGKTCVYNQNNMMVLAGFIIRIRVNERVLPQFLSTYLNTDFSKKMLAAMCKTAIGQANINAQELQNICIYVPPIKLQEEFVKFKKQTDKSKLTK